MKNEDHVTNSFIYISNDQHLINEHNHVATGLPNGKSEEKISTNEDTVNEQRVMDARFRIDLHKF
ncbi:hypothetical protein ACFSCX_10990 [Bacillus salitolerans]|uniref:Uncharacterized protein n=1 Tax=Bacillus salitolerans TaxID=1437434 RepID=A0ABW4LPS2_9BACI